MPDTTTTNLGLTKPAVGEEAGRNLWGGKWNTNADLIDAAVGTAQDDIATLEANVNDLGTDLTAAEGDIAALETSVAALRVVPPGALMPYAGSSAPTGWLLCQGQAVSRTTYAALFSAIGTTYGSGDGSTTFNVPDLGGRVVAGKENTATRLTASGSGINGATLGAAGGAETHTLTSAQMPVHSHGVSDPGHSHTITGGQTTTANFTGRAGNGDGSNNYAVGTSGNATGISIQNAGSGGAHNNTQPTIVLNYIIAI